MYYCNKNQQRGPHFLYSGYPAFEDAKRLWASKVLSSCTNGLLSALHLQTQSQLPSLLPHRLAPLCVVCDCPRKHVYLNEVTHIRL